ncbi:MAG: hypothetical protein ACE5FO_04550 [Parvularculaceae bacterium]
MMKHLVIALVAAGGLFAVSSAGATNWTENVALCAAALDEQGVADADRYVPRLKKTRDGATKRVTVKMAPLNDDLEAIVAECRIRSGEVVDVSIKA